MKQFPLMKKYQSRQTKKQEGIQAHTDVHIVIKRLIAIEGDKIKVLSTGQIVLNGEILQEDYVNTINREILYEKFYGTNGLKIKNPDLFIDDELFVPKNHIFYLGDNRGESEDCASYGPIHKKYLIARVDYVIKAGESKPKKI